MKTSIPGLFILLVSILFFSTTTAVAQNGKLFTVDDSGDTNDAVSGDGICADANGKCTLRAAIHEANFDNFADAVIFALPFPATINLTLGELAIDSTIYIVGPGARNLTVQRSTANGTADFRVFHVLPAAGPLVEIRALKISNGRVAGGDGGGIYIEESNVVHLLDVTISENLANRGGGVASSGSVIIGRSLIRSNLAVVNQNVGGIGGGFFNQGPFGGAEIVNSMVTENGAITGGAVYNASGLFLINSTISHNTAENAGVSVFNAPSRVADVLNTIVGMDSPASASSLSGSFNSYGNNLITDARNSTGFTNGVNNDQVSNNNTINPLLGNLANNGGQSDTRALINGSPAIDRGNNCINTGDCPKPFPPGYRLSTDQRLINFRLAAGVVDIGAFEHQSSTINGNVTLGVFSNGNRAGGTLVVLTKASTNEKQTRISNPVGNFRFTNLSFGDVYIMERMPKRFGERRGLGIFSIDFVPFPLPTRGDESVIITWQDN